MTWNKFDEYTPDNFAKREDQEFKPDAQFLVYLTGHKVAQAATWDKDNGQFILLGNPKPPQEGGESGDVMPPVEEEEKVSPQAEEGAEEPSKLPEGEGEIPAGPGEEEPSEELPEFTEEAKVEWWALMPKRNRMDEFVEEVVK